MRSLTALFMAAAILLAVDPAFTRPASASGPSWYAVDVTMAGPAVLTSLRTDSDVAAWYELGDVIVVSGTTDSRKRAARLAEVTDVVPPRNDEVLYLTRHVHPNDVERLTISRPGGRVPRVLASSGLYALVSSAPEDISLLDDGHSDIAPAYSGTTVARSLGNDFAGVLQPSSSKAAALNGYADAVDPERWRAAVATLAGFRTRYVGTGGLSAARDYLAGEFQSLGLTVTTPEFLVGNKKAQNVVAELRGTTRPDELYVVCGHYDSISEQPLNAAPGAEDNASGAAGVLELARVFAARPPEASIRFIAFSGEEFGLVGSEDYVESLVRDGDSRRVRGVITMDMIGFSRDGDLDVLLESSGAGADLVDVLATAAAAVSDLRVVVSYNPFGSDHVPFLEAGIPSVLTIENDWDAYRDYHKSSDRIENVRLDMGGQILRMNAAALGHLAGNADGEEPMLSARVRFATDRTTVYGGFTLPIEWTASGGSIESFDVEASVDDGSTWSVLASQLPAGERNFNWTVPEDARSNRAFVRVTAHFEGGSLLTDASVPLSIRPSGGPAIKAVKFKPTTNADFFIKGRFGDDAQLIEVSGVQLPGAIVDPRYVDGNVTSRIFGIAPDLDAIFPKGVTVQVRVVDMRTGVATAHFAVTR